jgi:hypothetical protein
MERKYAVLLTLNVVFFVFFVSSSLYLENLFAQPTYHATYLTKTEYELFTIRIQYWNYTDGAFIPTTDLLTYPNYPAILFYVSFIINGLFFAVYLRKRKQA